VEIYCKVAAVAITTFANTTAIITMVIAIFGPPLLLLRCRYLCATDYKLKSSILHICISFCFGNGNGNSDGNDNGNGDGHGNSNGNGNCIG
jgi:hypothetical protein